MKLLALLAVLLALTDFAGAAAVTVTLTWTASTTPGTTVNIYRCAGTGCTNFVPIASGQASTSYVDSAVSVGDYVYYVTAVANGKESKPSATVTATILPQPPTGLTVTTQ